MSALPGRRAIRTPRHLPNLPLLLLLACFAALPVLRSTALAQDAAPCGLCTGKLEVACPTCEGDGETTGTCLTCDGARRRECPQEHPHLRRRRCPSRFHPFGGGKVLWDDWKLADCKLCGRAGLVPCRGCTLETRQRCRTCKGMKGAQVERACVDCAGQGKLPCVLCAAAGPCRACADTHARRCPQCNGAGEAEQTCTTCFGEGHAVCGGCAGVRKVACPNCYGTGKQRAKYDDETTAYTKGCIRCRKKGHIPCGRCKTGFTVCLTCDGDGKDRLPCGICESSGELPCVASEGRAFDLFRLGAALLEARGRREDALRLYDEYLRRATPVVERLEARVRELEEAAPSKPSLLEIWRRRPRGQNLSDAEQAAEREHRQRVRAHAKKLLPLVRRRDTGVAHLKSARKARADLIEK